MKRRDRAFVVVTAGVTSVHGGLPAPALAIGKGQHPPSGIWTVTEVTQKPCHLPYPARVQRRFTGSGTGGWGLGRGQQQGGGGRGHHGPSVSGILKDWSCAVGKYDCAGSLEGKKVTRESLETKSNSSKSKPWLTLVLILCSGV